MDKYHIIRLKANASGYGNYDQRKTAKEAEGFIDKMTEQYNYKLDDFLVIKGDKITIKQYKTHRLEVFDEPS